MPTIIENNFGVLGLNVHIAHYIAGMSFELAGYTAYGKRANLVHFLTDGCR